MNNIFDLLKLILKDTSYGIKGYFKSRVIIMAIVFGIVSLGLLIVDAPMPYLIAFIIALIDIVPLLGAGIIMIPWGVFSYFGENRDMGVGVLILYVVLTISKQFIEPKILGDQIGIKPLYTFAATILGSLILGPIGLILGPILAVVINSIIKSKKLWDKKIDD